MRDSTSALWKLLRAGKPVAVVLYEDYAAREQLLELSYLVAPSDYEVHRTDQATDAFLPDRLGTLLLLAPSNEIEAVRRLDARAADLVKRTAPVVLFLLRRGSGRKELVARRTLAFMLREQEVDPDEIDSAEVNRQRQLFTDEMRQTPEEWLTAWRGGEKPDTEANSLLLHQALLLERQRSR